MVKLKIKKSNNHDFCPKNLSFLQCKLQSKSTPTHLRWLVMCHRGTPRIDEEDLSNNRATQRPHDMTGVSGIRKEIWNAYTLPVQILKLMILQVTTAPWRARKWSDPACQLRTLRLAGSLVTCDTINRDLAPFIRSRVPASRLLELDRYLRHLGLMLPDLQKVHKCLCFLIHANISYYSN